MNPVKTTEKVNDAVRVKPAEMNFSVGDDNLSQRTQRMIQWDPGRARCTMVGE